MNLTSREKRVWVKGLLIDCPVGKPLDTCPANEIRCLPADHIIKLVNHMPDEQIDALIKYHTLCEHTRLCGEE